jgi:PAS domain S-box-containing protein
LEAGATDYLAKDVYDVSRLQHAIQYALERQSLLEELETERYLLHSLMQSLPDNIYFKDRDSRFLRVSAAMAKWFGADSTDAVVGRSDSDYFTEEHAKQARLDEAELMQSGDPVLGKEEKETWPDGRTTWVSTSKMPLKDRDGKVVGTFGISRDVTQEKLALLALQRNEERSRLIVDTALDAFVSIDSEGTIVEWNPRAESTFGWQRVEAIGKSIESVLIPSKFHEAFHAGFRRFQKTGESDVLKRRLEMTALHKSGDEFPVEMTISPIRHEDSHMFAAFIHDISRRKEAERELRESKEAANEAKSDFLANMSHEIRTPMNAVIGMTELVLDTELSASQREYLSMARDSADALLGLINDILDFSKIEAGKLELESKVFGLRDSLGDTLKSLAIRAQREDLELACHIEPNVADALIGDASRVRQVVVNLVGNAIKFTERGEVVVKVEVDEQSDHSVLLHFTISDTGIGISAPKQKTIFQAFEQADTSTTRKYGGTGLGLAICARLVRLMHGSIWVDSQLGSGSNFHFTVRLGISDEAPTQPARRIVQGTRVLVVDDNATNRMILDEMLRNWGLDVTVVEGVQEALLAMQTARQDDRLFSLLLSDVNMPDEDGFDLVEHINKGKLTDAVILMLTSSDRPGEIQRCRDLGVAGQLRKPIKQSELFDAIVEALQIEATEPINDTDIALASTQSDEASISIPPLRILLVEDSVVNQKLSLALLKNWDHSVTIAGNGVEALTEFASSRFDLILMDVQMPKMDGLEATRKIRESEQQAGGHIPIIAMTAHAMKGDRERCLESGMDDYVSKPVRAVHLLKAMATQLEGVDPNSLVLHGASGGRSEQEDSIQQSIAGENEAVGTASSPGKFRINWPAALKLVSGDRELLQDIAEASVFESKEVLKGLHTAFKPGDAPTVRRLAHTIKASFRMFGVEDAYEIALVCENAAHDGDVEAAQSRMSELKTAVDETSTQLLRFIDTRQVPS